MAGFALVHLVPRLAVSMPASAPTAAQADVLVDTDPIENTFAQVNDVPTPDKDTFTIRGRVSVDTGATPVADGVANGVVVTILQSALPTATCDGYTTVDTKAFAASQCEAVEKGRSLYCKDSTDGSFFRLRRSKSPTSFRVNTIVRGRNFAPWSPLGPPNGIPLAGEVRMTQAHWFGQTEVERCRVTHNGERTACRGKGVSPLPPPCPTPTPVGLGPTPAPSPTPFCSMSTSPTSIRRGEFTTFTVAVNRTFPCLLEYCISIDLPAGPDQCGIVPFSEPYEVFDCNDNTTTYEWSPLLIGGWQTFRALDPQTRSVLCSASWFNDQ